MVKKQDTDVTSPLNERTRDQKERFDGDDLLVLIGHNPTHRPAKIGSVL